MHGPDGHTPLSRSGAIGGLTQRDGKVYLSIVVDAAQAANAEPMRAAAERALRGVAGVSAAIVTLTAERPPGAPPARGHSACAGRRQTRGPAARSRKRRRRAQHHRHCFGQGRRRQIDHRRQSRHRHGAGGLAGRPARRRRVRPLGAASVRPQREAQGRTVLSGPAGGLWRQGDLDRPDDRRGGPGRLARPDGDVGGDAVAARGGVGRTRLPGGGHAAGHRRRATDHGPKRAAGRRDHRFDAPGPRADRRPARYCDVREGSHPRAGNY